MKYFQVMGIIKGNELLDHQEKCVLFQHFCINLLFFLAFLKKCSRPRDHQIGIPDKQDMQTLATQKNVENQIIQRVTKIPEAGKSEIYSVDLQAQA